MLKLTEIDNKLIYTYATDEPINLWYNGPTTNIPLEKIKGSIKNSKFLGELQQAVTSKEMFV